MRFANKGQAVGEYVTIIGLVAIASLVSVIAMENGLQGTMQSLVSFVTNGQSAGGSGPAVAVNPTGANFGGGGAGNPSLPPLFSPTPETLPTGNLVISSQNVCFTNGSCVNMPVISAANPSNPVTTGANGGQLSLAMAAVLSQLANETASQPNADPTFATLIMDLATLGHQIADIQNTLAINCPFQAGGGCAGMTQAQLNSQMLGMQLASDNFSEQLAELLASPAYQSLPAPIRALIMLASQNIQNIVEGTEPAQIAAGGGSMFGFVENNAPVLEMNANTICTAGGQDECVEANFPGQGQALGLGQGQGPGQGQGQGQN